MTARFPWTHFGSMGFNQGLLLGNRQGSTRTPQPRYLTWRLWSRIQMRTR